MKLLLTGAIKYTDEQIEYLKSLGNDIVYVQDERNKIDFDVSDIEGVVCNGLFLYNDIRHFKKLKYIQLTSAGFDRVPIDYINEHDIKIYNARGVYSIPMSEFALCGVLQFIKQSRLFYKNQNNHIWEKSRTLGELSGKKVIIVGAGNIGSEVAKRFSAFDASVIGVDITDDDRKYFDKIELLDNLDEQLKIADIVILTLPLTDSTRGMFDKSKFDLMKKSSIFVNIARGPLVVESDLINSLKSGDISGAVLDVFEEEPLNENSPLWDMDNVILTPHNSFVGENNNRRMFDVIVNNLEKRNE
ncbi:MAG: hydroxyacid dehydrogenase [Eubacterium sp.]|nr:hydroxyacid dehydrogenase [Eubacterium sp.]